MGDVRNLRIGSFSLAGQIEVSGAATGVVTAIHAPIPDDPPSMDIPGQLQTGKAAKINYSNPDLAGQEVTIQVSNGEGATDQVAIQLGADGSGSGDWTPPAGWWLAKFNGPAVGEVTKVIFPPTK